MPTLLRPVFATASALLPCLLLPAPLLAHSGSETPHSSSDWIGQLLADPNAGAGVVALCLAVSVVLGALHALTPGHGKTMVAAYLIGTRGRIIDAVSLGLIVTLTHTFSIYLLGVVALLFSQYVLPETLFPWFGLVSGAGVMGLGAYLFIRSSRNQEASADPNYHSHGWYSHSHAHAHAPKRLSWEIVTLGISGGMIPCPDALAVLLLAMALNQILLGLAMVVAFSVGLAAVLIGIGVMVVIARPLLERYSGGSRLLGRILPRLSAAAVTLIGLVFVIKSGLLLSLR